MSCKYCQKGFTLIELSIVLVIIGLLVGGVLVGRDMIRSASLRQDIAQFNELNAAMNTFKVKYDCLAGDCPNASNFMPSAHNGNGDGIISNSTSGYNYSPISQQITYFTTESAYLWDDLARAKLIKLAPFNTDMPTNGVQPMPGLDYVALTTRPQFGIIVGCDCEASVATGSYLLVGIGSADSEGLNSTPAVYSTADAFYIDTKIDDGKPFSGTIISSEVTTWDDGTMFSPSTPAVSGSCVSTSTGNPYNFNEVLPRCALRIKGAF